jgi:hypothetical protein
MPKKNLGLFGIALIGASLAAPALAGVVILKDEVPFDITEDDLPVEVCGTTFTRQAIHDLVAISDYVTTEKMRCAREVFMDAFVVESESKNAPGATDVWKSNSSMNMSQQLRLSRSPCLAVLTNRFYTDVHDRFDNFRPEGSKEDVLPKSERPSLIAEAGKGSFAELKPGFLMDQAVKLAGGRKSLAMAMVAHCGHDDQNNQIPTVVDFSSASARKVVTDYLQRKAGSIDRDDDQERIDHILKGGRMSATISCPKPNSPFYVAKALGAGADIDPALKKKIAQVQAPTKGGGVLPGKAYHTNFGAIIGCRLAACGVSKGNIQSWLALIANRYRAHRMNYLAADYLTVREIVEERFDVNWNNEKGMKAIGNEISEWLNSKEGKQELVKRGAEALASDDRGKMEWSAWQSNIDSAILVRGAVPGQQSVFQAVRFSEGRDPYHDPNTVNKPQTSYCPGWSEERCNESRKRYETWMIDFDWSEAQQRAGGGFGADFCGPDLANDSEVEQQACEALKKL